MNQNTLTLSASKDLKLGALLTFIGVNLRFVVGNIIHGLIYFNFLQSGNHEHRYEVHVPNLPDMCGDIAIMMVFASAYFFITAGSVKKRRSGSADNFPLTNAQDLQPVGESMSWVKSLFFISIIGFGLYFFSKYFFSIELETFFEEDEESGIAFILHITNYLVRLCSVFAFVTVYCRYLSLKRTTTLIVYVFFFTRFLFATNMLEFVHTYDLYIGASILDFLTPILIVYSMISLFII